jgi:hypothetical protein
VDSERAGEVGACSDSGSFTNAGEEPEEELGRGILSVTDMTLEGSDGRSKVGWGPSIVMSILGSGGCGTACESSAASAGEAEVVTFGVPVVGVAGVLKGGDVVSNY